MTIAVAQVPLNVQIDLTPFVRGGVTGIARSAGQSYRALMERADPRVSLQAVSRARAPGCADFSLLTALRRPRGTIYHSFEHRLPFPYRARTVMTVHDAWTLAPNEWQPANYQTRQAPLFRRALRRADRLVVPSQATADKLVEFDSGLREKIRVVPWGPLLLPAGHAALASDSEADHRAHSGARMLVDGYLAEKRPFILMVGVLEPRKNHALLLRALESVPEVDVIFAGILGYRGEAVRAHILAAAAKGTPARRIMHIAHLNENELRRLYLACSALVLPSFDEGFGLPVLEALALGKPVIASRIAPLIEIAGEAALYFDPRAGVEELSAHLRALLGTPALGAELGARARVQSRHFGWERTARELIEVYLSLA